jgi:hypothetical protein
MEMEPGEQQRRREQRAGENPQRAHAPSSGSALR